MAMQVYALTRLVKGLSSGRMAARQGFALALMETLHRLSKVPTEAVLGLMDIWLEASNSMKVRCTLLIFVTFLAIGNNCFGRKSLGQALAGDEQIRTNMTSSIASL